MEERVEPKTATGILIRCVTNIVSKVKERMVGKPISFTMISLSDYGRIGLNLSGTGITTEPEMFSTEMGAIERIVKHYAENKGPVVLKIDNSCYTNKSKRSMFVPDEFLRKANEHVEKKRGSPRPAKP